MSMYSFAGNIIYNNPVKGVIIDAAQIAVNFSRFERGFTTRTKAQLTEWYDQTLFHIQGMRAHSKEQYFPMNPESCGKYGGCQFRGICGRDPSVREQFLKGEFIQGTVWDPVKRARIKREKAKNG